MVSTNRFFCWFKLFNSYCILPLERGFVNLPDERLMKNYDWTSPISKLVVNQI